MKDDKIPTITVLSGGMGEEREVSLTTGRAICKSLKKSHEVILVDLEQTFLPPDLDGESTIVFPAIHGTFGEDGDLQQQLDDSGIHCVESALKVHCNTAIHKDPQHQRL